ncbi:MAG: isochorismatase family protein [Sulfurospirillaceae bacterium]|nr:isochorismatase family protein [Sulfurospirillaceae bacterium]
MITEIDKKTALVLIDLQQGIIAGEKAHPTDSILAKANELIQAFRAAKLPIIFVNVNPIGATWTRVRAEVAADMSKMLDTEEKLDAFLEITPVLDKTPKDIYVTKNTWNAFYNTALHRKLQEKNVTGIVLAGISTSIGVEGTARAASELGYNLTFALDATTDRVLEAHDHSIKYIFPRIGELGSVKEVIEKLPK